MDASFYTTISKEGQAEFRDRGSRFIAYAFPVGNIIQFKEKLEEVKKEHPKATHHCFAYRIGIDGNTFRVSDDGEPSGTAGRPILGQIDSKQLTDLLIIVVRYFGGTLLGVPGLIAAYKTAASMVLQTTTMVQKSIDDNYIIHFDYQSMNDIMIIVKQHGCTVISQEMSLFCNMTIGIPRSRVNEVVYRLEDIRNVEVKKMPG